MTKIRFEWPYGGNAVFLSGSFNRWTKYRMTKENSVYVIDVHLNSNKTYYYKFIVDGVWMYDIMKPNCNDGFNSFNNVITVRHEHSENTLSDISSDGTSDDAFVDSTKGSMEGLIEDDDMIKINHINHGDIDGCVEDSVDKTLDNGGNPDSNISPLTTIYSVNGSMHMTRSELNKILEDVDKIQQRNKIIHLNNTLAETADIDLWEIRRRLFTTQILSDVPTKLESMDKTVHIYGSSYNPKKRIEEEPDVSVVVTDVINQTNFRTLKEIRPLFCLCRDQSLNETSLPFVKRIENEDFVLNWGSEEKKNIRWSDRSKTIITSRDHASLKEQPHLTSVAYFNKLAPSSFLRRDGVAMQK
ncbi:hypothetical protein YASMINEVIRUS_608 [Yasminevirus sp. GU-2018]|uniref:AMP-activated protein kinase glycogen-binding domain-containing protein n=1 Tax=Yasminevirus sp. GU-2018 TaxID=2420051 RepID=A0A5K0U8M8_9VIRU|nr:hypothetical protein YASMINEVIRUS_608 [Yasminevirus sp. GU-2018]